MQFWKITSCIAVLSLGAGFAHADIVTPTSVTASSEFAAAENMINGTGLSGGGPVESQTHDNDENNLWQTFSASSIGETAEFVFDQSYDLADIVVWQYNGLNGFGEPETDREIDEFALAVSPDLVAPFVPLGTYNLDPAQDPTSPLGEPAQIVSLPSAPGARRVLLTINSVHGGVSDGNAGLSEVRFQTESVVPVEAVAWGEIKSLYR